MKPPHQELSNHTEKQPADCISPDAAAFTQQKVSALNGLIEAVHEIHHQSRQIKEIARTARDQAETGASQDTTLTETSASAANTLNELAKTLRKSIQLFRMK